MEKIALIIPNLLRGGSERFVSNLSQRMAKDKEVYVIAFDGRDAKYKVGGTLIDLGLPARHGKIKKVINVFKRISKIKKILKEKEIKTVLSFTENANLVTSFLPKEYCRIISCRGYGELEKHGKSFYKQYKRCDAIMFNSLYMRDYFKNRFNVQKDNLYVVYNLFDFDNINNIKNDEVEGIFNKFVSEHKTISQISHFSKYKGHLIKAFEMVKEEVPDAGLVFIGDRGSKEADIKRMADWSKVGDDILFVGFQENPFKFLSKTDVYALPSIYEGFPNALVEAMAVGLPVVSTDCKSGPREILEKEYSFDSEVKGYKLCEYGILTEPFGEEIDYDLKVKTDAQRSFADALVKMLKDDSLRENYAKKSIERCQDFESEKIYNEYLSVVERIVNGRSNA